MQTPTKENANKWNKMNGHKLAWWGYYRWSWLWKPFKIGSKKQRHTHTHTHSCVNKRTGLVARLNRQRNAHDISASAECERHALKYTALLKYGKGDGVFVGGETHDVRNEMKLQSDAFVRALRYNCFSREFTTNDTHYECFSRISRPNRRCRFCFLFTFGTTRRTPEHIPDRIHHSSAHSHNSHAVHGYLAWACWGLGFALNILQRIVAEKFKTCICSVKTWNIQMNDTKSR